MATSGGESGPTRPGRTAHQVKPAAQAETAEQSDERDHNAQHTDQHNDENPVPGEGVGRGGARRLVAIRFRVGQIVQVEPSDLTAHSACVMCSTVLLQQYTSGI